MVTLLKDHGIPPTAQRLAVARYVLETQEHPSADEVWTRVRDQHPKRLSRATVYNTLNLFVAKGLLRALVLAEGRTVFDPKMGPHHHFIDESTGDIHDIPWDAVKVAATENLPGFRVEQYQVVMRGQRLRR